MSWTRLTTLTIDATPEELATDGRVIYMRCASSVAAWEHDTPTARWVATFKDHGQCPDIVIADGVAIVCSLASDVVLAFDVATGRKKWQIPEAWIFEHKSVEWRGLHVSRKQRPGPFVVIDPKTGQRSEAGSAPITWEILGVGGRIALGSRDGLYVSGETELNMTMCVACGAVSDLVHSGNDVYFTGTSADGRPVVGWVNIIDPERRATFTFSDPKLNLKLSPGLAPGNVWARNRDNGWLACIDIPAGNETWRLQRQDQYVDQVAVTPHGVMVLGSTGDKKHLRYIFEVDSQTGLVPASIDDRKSLARSLHYIDGYLLVGRVKDLTEFVDVYEWNAGDGASPHPTASTTRIADSDSLPEAKVLGPAVSDSSVLPALIREFAEIMRLAPAVRGPRAAAFNTALDAYLAAHPSESVGTFAMHVAIAGGDRSLHGAVLADMIQLRSAK